jgi:hypothetical protein
MKDATSVVLLDHLRVLEIIGMLWFFLRVQVIKRAIELAKAVRGG